MTEKKPRYAISRKRYKELETKCSGPGCGIVMKHRENYQRKFCCNKCQQNAQWEERKKSILRDEKQDSPGLFRRLFDEQNRKNCFECGLAPEWNNKPLTLQLDHIDGDSQNHVFSNIRLLCPNCHWQTETWGYKMPRRKKKAISSEEEYCSDIAKVGVS